MATLKALRQLIGVKMQNLFFKQFGKSVQTATGGSTTTLVDTGILLQVDDFWNGHYVYFPATQEVREVDDFDQGTSTITWLAPLSAAIEADDEYEIWAQVSPIEVNEAIVNALRQGWPDFFETNTEYVVVKSYDGEGYTLADVLTYTPKWVAEVWLEGYTNSLTGTAESATNNTMTDTGVFATMDSSVDSWEIRIYQGTGAGQRRTVSSNTDDAVTVSVNWTTNPDTTSMYRAVKVSSPERMFHPFMQWEVDSYENPTELRLGSHLYGYEGHCLRVRYEYEYPEISAETDSTNAMTEYVILAARLELYENLIASSSAVDVPEWEKMYGVLERRLRQLIESHRYDHLDASMNNPNGYGYTRDPEYPF